MSILAPMLNLNNSELGNHSYVNSNTRISYAKVGKFCSIGPNVTIGMGIHPTHLISTHPAFYSTNKEFKTFSDKNYFREYEKQLLEMMYGWKQRKINRMG